MEKLDAEGMDATPENPFGVSWPAHTYRLIVCCLTLWPQHVRFLCLDRCTYSLIDRYLWLERGTTLPASRVKGGVFAEDCD